MRKAKVRLKTQGFLLVGLANTLGHPRLGLAVSRKQVKSAVKRNRLKRCVRESFRQSAAPLGAVDVLVIPNKQGATLSNQEVFHRLEKQWLQLSHKFPAA